MPIASGTGVVNSAGQRVRSSSSSASLRARRSF
jgi:hypothetical protein